MHVLSFDNLDAHSEIVAFATTRAGGVSDAPFDTLNLGLGTEDENLSVMENRTRVAVAAGCTLDRLVTAGQVHQTTVAVVTEETAGTRFDAIDALVTNIAEIPLMILTADCVGVFFFDPEHQAIGVAHAGWKGTLGNVVAATLGSMHAEFGTIPAHVAAAIGPSIGSCCYTVGTEVVDAFYAAHTGIADEIFSLPDFASAGSFEAAVNKGTQQLDLWKANELMLIDAGVDERNIDIAEICTSCETSRFYSHRAENGKTGRFGALIKLHATR